MKIGYLGPSGSHSQAAAEAFRTQCLQHADERVTLLPMMTLTQILDSVEEKALELGCIPVENLLEGSVAEVLDGLSLHLSKTAIIAEFIRPIQHTLIRKYSFMEGIEFIHSHPQAIGQCRESLISLLGNQIRFITASSTSEAVKALETLDETHAAIGTTWAAKQYGMDVVIENLGGMDHNVTRFLMISAQQDMGNQLPDSLIGECYPVKTSLCLGLKENRSGALLEILTLLAEYQLNMTKIESRPTKKNLGEYLFYIDIQGEVPQPAEAALRKRVPLYKCLGVYPMLGLLLDQKKPQ